MRSVSFYFDFISPYAWIALKGARAFAEQHGIRWELRPVVYSKLLDHHGLSGPAESPGRQRYAVHDAARCAELAGLQIVGPPSHPFRSLEALRTACLFLRQPEELEVCVAIADAGWGREADLTDVAVLEQVLHEDVGLQSVNLAERIAEPGVKQLLHTMTAEALSHDVFGVPTFRLGKEIFWGQDRLAHLAARLDGKLEEALERGERLFRRPRGSGSPLGAGAATAAR